MKMSDQYHLKRKASGWAGHCCQTLLVSSRRFLSSVSEEQCSPHLLSQPSELSSKEQDLHMHPLDRGKLDVNTDEVVCSFIDQYVKLGIPDDEEL